MATDVAVRVSRLEERADAHDATHALTVAVLERLEQSIKALQADMATVKVDLATVKADLATVKATTSDTNRRVRVRGFETDDG